MAAMILAVLLATAAQDQPAKEKSEAKNVAELQKERIATLKEIVTISTKLAQANRVAPGEALEARMTLLKAEVEATEKDSDRITLYQNALADLTACLALAKTQLDSGRGSELAYLKIKATHLEVQIQLRKLRDAKEKK